MFIRFRPRRSRLYVSLMRSDRVDGKVKQTTIAPLAAMSAEMRVRERQQFWEQLHRHLEGVDPKEAEKIMMIAHERIPIPTMEEIGATDLASAEHDIEFWQNTNKQTHKIIDCHENLITSAQKKLAEWKQQAQQETEKIEQAKAKAARLDNFKGIAP
jgi:hypothetical protein